MGNPKSKVVAMPRLLRIITGGAPAPVAPQPNGQNGFDNGGALTINRATLSIRNYTGGTPIGAAIHNGHADQLPEEFRPKPPTIVQKILYKTGFSRPPFG